MKAHNFGRRLATFVSVLALIFMPVHSVLAASGITLDVFSGTPRTVQVSGWGFNSGETVDLFFNNISGAPVVNVVAGADSQFTAALSIPANTPQGPLPIWAVGQSSGFTGSNSFYVVTFSPRISIASWAANTPGASLSVSGNGFAPGETVNFSLGSASAGSVAADSSGSFVNATATIPSLPSGTYQFHAVGASSGADAFNGSYTYFYVGGFYPSSYPSTYYLLPTQTLSFSGSGWAPGETITVTESSTTSTLSTFTAAADGSFFGAGSFVVPFSFLNSVRNFNLSGSVSGGSVSVSVTVGQFYPFVYPSGYYIAPNQPLSFSGGGFGGGETIKVYQGTSLTPLSSFTASSDGTFLNAGSFTVPFTYAGSGRVFRLVGMSSGAETEVPVTIGQFYPTLSPSSYFVKPGQSLTISGSGFAPNEIVDLTLGGTAPVQVTASSSGSFTGAVITMPFTSLPFLNLNATGESSRVSASVLITVGTFYPVITPSTYYAFPGENVIFNFSDFAPNENVRLASGSSTLLTVAATATGAGSTSPLSIPYGSSGSKNYSFTGLSSGASANVNITIGTLFPYADASSYYTTAGSTVNVRGYNFARNENVEVTGGASPVTVQADNFGNTGSVPLQLPLASPSPVTLTLTGLSSGSSANVQVTLAPFSTQVTPSSWYVTPGALVSFSGTGFSAGENISISLNGSAAGTATATSTGSFSISDITIPASATSAYFVFTGTTSGASASVDISLAALSPSLWLSTYYDQAGQPLTVFGAGFGGNETVNITFEGAALGSASTDSAGNFTLATSVPYGAGGDKIIRAQGQASGAVTTVSFTQPQIYVDVQLGQYAGAPGDAVTFIGSGFLPNEPINIITDRTGSGTVANFNADASGSFNNSSYTLPTSFTGGPLTLTITGAYSFASKAIVYYVTGP